MIESTLYYIVKICGAVIRMLPVEWSLFLGRLLGWLAYLFDVKHKDQVLLNLKIAFSGEKTPQEIRSIAKAVFMNFGQHMIELLRLPRMNEETFKRYVKIEGREHVEEALQEGKGVILLAMHTGSWELANLASSMLGGVYKVMVNPQARFSRLDELLNSYRSCGGSVVLERGAGTRELLKSLKMNEIVAMVVDQGGKSGQRVPFFNREASLSVGAVRIALKSDTPVCFAIIQRERGPYHRLTIHKKLHFIKTGHTQNDIRTNLQQIARIMEGYIRSNPLEYMWFYKIWKYSNDYEAIILNDKRTGHLRQSQTVAHLLESHLKEQSKTCKTKIVDVTYRNMALARVLMLCTFFATSLLRNFRVGLLRLCLTPDSFRDIFSLKPDFIISCGSAAAYVNYLLAKEQYAKNIAVLKPGSLNYRHYDLNILPEHDRKWEKVYDSNVIYTKGAPNLITKNYLQENSEKLLKRFSHLKIGDNYKIGVLLGGDTKDFVLSASKVKLMLHQLVEASEEMNADILFTTSRRTSEKVEGLIYRHLKRFPRCRLLILANRNNVPEAVGGILGLSDIVIVSGDSISMISEAACSGKKTIVFPVQSRFSLRGKDLKHNRFIDLLTEQGYILSSDVKHIKQAVYNLVKNKIQLRILDDNSVIKVGLKRII